MNENKYGGTAFPTASVTIDDVVIHGELGMPLRDYFAAKAMQGLLFQENYERTCLSGLAYDIADSMLKARKK